MPAIYPIPTVGRASDILFAQRLLQQTQYHQTELLKIQEQASSGRRVNRPSEDPQASLRAIQLQRVLEQNTQYQLNVNITGSFLGESDSTITNMLDLLRGARGDALEAINASTSDTARNSIADQITNLVDQLVSIGNTKIRDRYLFSGADVGTRPFRMDQGAVIFDGDERRLETLFDELTRFSSNVSGAEVFGGISAEVKSEIDFNPILTADTRLATLNGGLGIVDGEIELSDGASVSRIDIRSAETVGDLIQLLETQPPSGRVLDVTIEPTGLVLNLDTAGGGYLAVREVNGGATAQSLGLKTPDPNGGLTVTGGDLDPALTLKTELNEILGVRAETRLLSQGTDNDLLIRGLDVGDTYNDYSFHLVDDETQQAAPGLSQGNEQVSFSAGPVAARGALALTGLNNNLLLTANATGAEFNQVQFAVYDAGAIGDAATVNYDAANKVLQVGIDSSGSTRVQTLVNAINAEGTFTTSYDASDPADGGYNPLATIPPANIGLSSGNTSNTGSDSNTYFVRINAKDSTANDIISALQSHGGFSQDFEALLIEADATSGTSDGTGVPNARLVGSTSGGEGEPLDRSSGFRIQIGNQVTTIDISGASNVEDLLNIINHSGAPIFAEINKDLNSINVRSRASGVDFSIGENGGTTATQLGLRSFTRETSLTALNYGRGIDTAGGTDFSIRRNDGSVFDIDVSSAKTIGDVLDIINEHPDNQVSSTRVEARLALTGNGIELVDDNPPSNATLAVVKATLSQAAVDLGLVPVGQLEGYPSDAAPPTAAGLTVEFPIPNHLNTAFQLTAQTPGTELNGVQVIFTSGTVSGDNAQVTFDSVAKTLTIDVDPTATTTNTVLQALDADGNFTAELIRDPDPGNNGNGLIPAAGLVGTTTGGSSQSSAQPATASLAFPAPNDVNTALTVTAALGGTRFNDVDVIFVDALAGDTALASYDSVAKQLTIQLDAAATTSNTIANAINLEGTFTAALNTSLDPTNDGTGVPTATGTIASTSGGTPEVLVGRDVNPKENESVFNTLLKLADALRGDLDIIEAKRTLEHLELDLDRALRALSDVGSRERAVESMKTVLEDQALQIQSSISLEIDADLVEVVSEMTSQQAAYQAALQMMGRNLQLSLLNYL